MGIFRDSNINHSPSLALLCASAPLRDNRSLPLFYPVSAPAVHSFFIFRVFRVVRGFINSLRLAPLRKTLLLRAAL